MKATWAVAAAVMGTMASIGCASTSVNAVRAPADVEPLAAETSIRVGESHVIDRHVNVRALKRSEPQGADSQRVVLDDGGYVLFWTAGTAEWGRRALAQSFDADGSPRSAATTISRPDVDVMDTPRINVLEGQHLVATFAAASESSVALVAVSLEVPAARGRPGVAIAANR